ncbi:MAG: MarR family transcriptional regulator [Promethearchaeota archaeon]
MKSFLPSPLSDYFDKVSDFIKEISELNGRKRKHMEVFFLLNYFPNLTQKKIQNLTSYSPGTISKILNELQRVGTLAVKKKKLSKENLYYLPKPRLTLDYWKRANSKVLTAKIIEFSQELSKDMDKLEPQHDDILFLENMLDFSSYFKWSHKFFVNEERFKNGNKYEINPYSSHLLVKQAPRPLNPKFSEPFMKLEEVFIKFFVENQIFEEMSDKNSIILGYFITRGTLTIAHLTELVSFSIATVSKSVHYLEELKFIQKNQDSYGYTLFSFGIGWLNYRQYYYHRISIWENLFHEIEKDIEEKLDSYHFIPEFPRFYYFFRKILGTCKRYQSFHHEAQFLWEDAGKFVEKYPQNYPNLVFEINKEAKEDEEEEVEKKKSQLS